MSKLRLRLSIALDGVPILLGATERPWDGLDDLRGLALVRTVAAPDAVHPTFARG